MSQNLKEILLLVEQYALDASARCGNLEAQANAGPLAGTDHTAGSFLHQQYCGAWGERKAYHMIFMALLDYLYPEKVTNGKAENGLSVMRE